MHLDKEKKIPIEAYQGTNMKMVSKALRNYPKKQK